MRCDDYYPHLADEKAKNGEYVKFFATLYSYYLAK